MTQSLMTRDANAEDRVGGAGSTAKRAIALMLPVALALGLFAPPYLPLQDYNEWIYQGYIAARMLLHTIDGPFSFVHYPVPNSLVQALLAGLDLVLPPLFSGAFVIGLYVVLAVTAGWKLAHRISAQYGVDYFLVLLVFAYFNSTFWNGYINYQFGIVLLSFFLLLDAEQRRSPALVLAFSVAAFFTHAVIWGTLLLLFLLDAVKRRRIAHCWPAVPSMGLFVWYVTHRPTQPAFQGFSPGGFFHTVAYKLYTVAKLGPYHNFPFGAGGDGFTSPSLYWAGVAVNLVVAAGLAFVAIEAFVLAAKRRRFEPELIAGAMLLVFFLAMPAVLADVVNPGERMLYPALLLILFRTARSRVIRWLAWSSPVLAVCAVSLALTGSDTWKRAAPAHPADQQMARVLFSSRPNQFGGKIDIVRGREPVGPLSFETSLLVNRKDGR